MSMSACPIVNQGTGGVACYDEDHAQLTAQHRKRRKRYFSAGDKVALDIGEPQATAHTYFTESMVARPLVGRSILNPFSSPPRANYYGKNKYKQDTTNIEQKSGASTSTHFNPVLHRSISHPPSLAHGPKPTLDAHDIYPGRCSSESEYNLPKFPFGVHTPLSDTPLDHKTLSSASQMPECEYVPKIKLPKQRFQKQQNPFLMLPIPETDSNENDHNKKSSVHPFSPDSTKSPSPTTQFKHLAISNEEEVTPPAEVIFSGTRDLLIASPPEAGHGIQDSLWPAHSEEIESMSPYDLSSVDSDIQLVPQSSPSEEINLDDPFSNISNPEMEFDFELDFDDDLLFEGLDTIDIQYSSSFLDTSSITDQSFQQPTIPIPSMVESAHAADAEFLPDLQTKPIKVPALQKTFSKGELWKFLLQKLCDPTCNPDVITWENQEAGMFRIVNRDALTALWATSRHKEGMHYDIMARAIRYYYQKGIILPVKVPKKHMVFRFGSQARGWKELRQIYIDTNK